MSHDPLCPWQPRREVAPGAHAEWYCQCDLITKARAKERERIANQLEAWADDPESDRPPLRSLRFSLGMAAKAVRRWGQP